MEIFWGDFLRQVGHLPTNPVPVAKEAFLGNHSSYENETTSTSKS